MKASTALLCLIASAWNAWQSEGTNLRTAVVEKMGCSYSGGGEIVDTAAICVYNHGGYAISYIQLYQSDSCEYNMQGSCVVLSSIVNSDNPGCFEPGSTFTVWINAVAAPCSYQAPWTFQITPYSQDVTVTSYGVLPYGMYSDMSTGPAQGPANAAELLGSLSCCQEGQSNCGGVEPCTAANAVCVTCATEANWELVSSGDTYTLQNSVSWSSSSSTTNSETTTNTIEASLGVQYDGVSASSSYTNSVANTVSTTFTETNGGSSSTTENVSCNSGSIYQWVVTVTQSFPGVTDQVTTITTSNFVCVPSDVNGQQPLCPPGYCGNLGQTGTGAGCQCCKNLDWASDPSTVSQLLCPSS